MSLPVRTRITAYHAVLACAMAALGVSVTMRAWADIFEVAHDDAEYQHIFLVPLVAIFLAFVRRQRLRYARVSGVILGPCIALVGWMAASYGFNYRTNVLLHLGAVLVLIGCITSVVGKQVLFRFFSVAVVLLLLVPLPGGVKSLLADTLQLWTAHICNYLLALVGVETTVFGSTLRINDQVVMIAEACNGMRMVFPLLLIAYAFAFGLPLNNVTRYLIVLMSPFVALLCNVLRVLPLIWLQGQGPPARDWGTTLHDGSGWFMVPIAFLVLLAIIRLLKWATVPVYRYPLASQGA
ncbi:MAG TPA: exosortase/archaeosortase family protein [Tepidisphaeraceae bacterium]|jgi:exosortase